MLRELRGNIESEIFQEKIMKPLYAELERVKNAYDCESLRELSTMKGKKQGLKFIIELLKRVQNEYNSAQYEIEELRKIAS